MKLDRAKHLHYFLNRYSKVIDRSIPQPCILICKHDSSYPPDIISAAPAHSCSGATHHMSFLEGIDCSWPCHRNSRTMNMDAGLSTEAVLLTSDTSRSRAWTWYDGYLHWSASTHQLNRRRSARLCYQYTCVFPLLNFLRFHTPADWKVSVIPNTILMPVSFSPVSRDFLSA